MTARDPADSPASEGPVADGPASEGPGSGGTEGSGPTGDDVEAEVADNEELFAQEAGVPPVDPVAQERDEYREALQRLQADFENYKKRVTKQTEELRERAAEGLVEKLLPVLDTADLALAHGGGEDVKQMSAALFAVLEKEGLQKIDNAGEAFDPTLHDAVAHEPGDGEQEVSEVLRAGYLWRGRVLRPAMVKVRG